LLDTANVRQATYDIYGQVPTPPNDDQVIGGQRRLRHQVAGDEHGPAIVGQRAQQVPDPPNPFRVQSVDGRTLWAGCAVILLLMVARHRLVPFAQYGDISMARLVRPRGPTPGS
jgi:hypothetical protein